MITYKDVPKSLRRNIEFRRDVLGAAAQDDQAKRELWELCRRDERFFFNVILFTYDPRLPDPARPFVTYPFQDEVLGRMAETFGKEDMLIVKSRDMGASWLSLGFIFHRWLFWDLQSILLGSRKEEYVDKAGDSKSLFGKFDFILKTLPTWMIPSHTRNKLHLRNHQNGSTIDGESTNSDFGRGDRRTLVFLDEFASVETAYEVESATRDVSNCRWYNSTPKGMGNAFHEKYEKLMELRPSSVMRLHWSQHPDKAIGLYTSNKDEVDNYRLKILDKHYPFPPDYKFIRDGKLRSPWYDEQCIRASSQQEIAQELDMDFAKSGWQFFDAEALRAIIAENAKPPLAEGEMIFHEGSNALPEFLPQKGGRLKLWVALDALGSFPRSETFVIGCDVCAGTGGSRSSNSVASVMGQTSGLKVAEFATHDIRPDEFAEYAMALGRFFHGLQQTQVAMLIWEDNGPGGVFGKRVIKRQYPLVFKRKSNEKSTLKKTTHLPGWWTSKENKKPLLGEYATALRLGDFKNPSLLALQECAEYIHEPNGDIIHSRSKVIKDIDPTVSGENHGDRVIADALCWRAREEGVRLVPTRGPRTPPPGSIGHRIELRKQEDAPKVWV